MRKRDILDSVNENPSIININREEYITDAENVRTKVTCSISPQSVRIYPLSGGSRLLSDESGNEQRVLYGMLVPSTGNVRAGTDVTDTFTHNIYGSLIVKEVTPQVASNVIVGYQCALEVVK